MGDTLDKLFAALTLEEKVSLLSGQDFWSVPGILRLGIGELRVTDGPNGSRGSGSLTGGVKSACFPCGIALGASWNTDLLCQVGEALASEVKSKGAHVLLAPTINLQRTTTNGRNFECYAEDGVLTAKLAVHYIKGLQRQGISATVKHFAGNESEFERTTINSEIDERTLREHYLYPFEQAVKQANVWAVMSSYNRLNGSFTAENDWLMNQVLRKEWGYDGIVMSDWFGTHSTEPTIKAGLNLEMPGPTRDRGHKLIKAIEKGLISRNEVEKLSRDILLLMQRVDVLQQRKERFEEAQDQPEHRALIRKAGAEACVLLKNSGILPMANPASRRPKMTLAVIGPNAKQAQIMGGGSARLNPHYSVSPYQGLVAQLDESQLDYAEGCSNRRYEPTLTGTFTAEYFASPDLSGDVVHVETIDEVQSFIVGEVAEGKVNAREFTLRITGNYLAKDNAPYRVGACAAGYIRVYVDGELAVDIWGNNWQRGNTFFADGSDEIIGMVPMNAGQAYQIVVEFACRPDKQLVFGGYHVGIGKPTLDKDLALAVDKARHADIAILFVGRNGEWDTEGCDLPDIRLPGRQNELIESVAAVNPNTVVVLQTGGPVEMPWLARVNAVLQAWYPGQEAGHAITDVLFGKQEPSGRLPQTFPVRWEDNPTWGYDKAIYPGKNGNVRYAEGEYFGYRHYDRRAIAPLFPFGFGLGYTEFSLAGVSVSAVNSGYEINVKLVNTGDRAGTTVIQAYVQPPPNETTERAVQALKAFQKVPLSKSSSKAVCLSLNRRDFAYFDTDLGSWKVPAGDYLVRLGFSSRDLRESVIICIKDDHIMPA